MHVRLRGRLICRDVAEADVVHRHLDRHVELTRAEPGCMSFDVTPTDDPLEWRVEELFADDDAFDAHQRRVAASEWGLVTTGIERRYTIERA